MYYALLFILLGAAFLLFTSGARRRSKFRIYGGIALGVLTLLLFWFMDFWGEALWYQSLGYGDRFWLINYTNAGFSLAGAVIAVILVYILTITIARRHRIIHSTARLAAVAAGAAWGYSNWETLLLFFNRVDTGIYDPVLGKDAGFYLFTLPFLDAVLSFLLIVSVIAFAASFTSAFIRLNENNLIFSFPGEYTVSSGSFSSPLFINAAVLIIVLAYERFINRYHLLFSNTGVVAGPGWTDVNVLLPAYYAVIALMMLIAVSLVIPKLRQSARNYYGRKFRLNPQRSMIYLLAVPAASILLLWILAFGILPGIFQWLVVEPNEITFERPYIQNNINFTRLGFGLNKIEEKEYSLSGDFTPETVEANGSIFDNIRLWDWQALDAVYRQFQSIRLYYEFSDVDIDRYTIDGKIRQVMISGREINLDNLPVQSQTFVNKRFQYTHGYGITMAAVNEFNEQGLPFMLIKDIPPVTASPSLKVTQPQIYFGENTWTHVIVNSKAKEFDYPSGDENVYTQYAGKGGVGISSLWRKFLYGWKFDGTNFLFSDYTTDKSRIMFHRQIEERVKLLVPFLEFDKDPYLVLSEGKLYWIIDAYTTSRNFPYSQPFETTENISYKEGNSTQTLTTEFSGFLGGVNYIRNSVKAVVNAYDGTTDFYIMDEKDPLIKVWRNIFPGLFKNSSKMPRDLYSHIRYPAELLLTQGHVNSKYHMTDPTVFYNQEDLWVRATAKYYNKIQPVEPYYIMWQLPGDEKPQFVLMLPFTPKNRQVLIGWIAGMCDPQNYGRFLAYQFPKDQTVLGPQQVETKIDQDSYLSGQLTLWDQRGSNVIRGNVLAIPVNNTIVYVEPIYLQAETAAYPELRLVVVMHRDEMSYAPTFEEALRGLFARTAGSQQTAERVQTGIASQINPGALANGQQRTNEKGTAEQQMIREANEAFNNYLRLNAERKFGEAARELERLQRLLQSLSDRQNNKK